MTTWQLGVECAPPSWERLTLRSILKRVRSTGRPDLALLSVNLPDGVVLRREGDGRPAPAHDLSTYQVVHRGNLVMNQLGKPHGALGVSAYEGIISPAYFVAEVLPAAEPRFVHHLLRSRPYISEYERRGKYMPPSQFDISWDQFRGIPIALPSLAEQRRIADYLDGEVARIDKLIAAKRETIDLTQARFDSLVFDKVTGQRHSERVPTGVPWVRSLPAHWGAPTLGRHYRSQLGKMLNSEAAAGPELYPYLRNVNVQWYRFDFSDLAVMSFDAHDRARCELRAGDLLVCEGGEVGRAAVWPGSAENIYFQKAIHRVRPIADGNTRFLMYCLKAAASQGVFAVQGNQSTIVHLTGEQLREHRFPFPPLDEQAAIVAELDDAAHANRELNRVVAEQIELLQERRRSLITAVVTGEMEVP